MLLTPAEIKPKSFEPRGNSFFFLFGMDASHVCFQSYQYQNLSEGADCVGGQLRGDKACPFSVVTKSGRVWRKVPESDARSVDQCVSNSSSSSSPPPPYPPPPPPSSSSSV